MDIKEHWLVDAVKVESPNSDERPDSDDISLLVIHNISLPPGEFGSSHVEKFFTNNLNINEHEFFSEIKDLRVSSHLFIRRTGELVQFVPFNKRAWHAGVSCYEGREQCNDFSIGIELEGTDNQEYEVEQYECLNQVTRALFAEYPKLSLGQIAGHSDIAPIRKTDPGPAFNWARYKALLCE